MHPEVILDPSVMSAHAGPAGIWLAFRRVGTELCGRGEPDRRAHPQPPGRPQALIPG